MTSKIRILRICEYCNNEFTARTTVTKFCSHSCSKKAWKKKNKEKKIEKSNSETSLKLSLHIEKIKANEYLTIPEAAILIRVSRSSIYRIIWSGALKVLKVRSKTIIFKNDLDDFLKKSTQFQSKENINPNEETEVITIQEILNLYSISEKTLNSMIKRKQITKKKVMGINFVPKKEIIKMLGFPKDKNYE